MVVKVILKVRPVSLMLLRIRHTTIVSLIVDLVAVTLSIAGMVLMMMTEVLILSDLANQCAELLSPKRSNHTRKSRLFLR
jgi:hypothetical protein